MPSVAPDSSNEAVLWLSTTPRRCAVGQQEVPRFEDQRAGTCVAGCRRRDGNDAVSHRTRRNHDLRSVRYGVDRLKPEEVSGPRIGRIDAIHHLDGDDRAAVDRHGARRAGLQASHSDRACNELS